MTLPFARESIALWPLGRLSAYAPNARTHSADLVAKVAASMVVVG